MDRAVQVRVLATVLVFGRAVALARDGVAEHEAGIRGQAAHVRAAIARHARTNGEVFDSVGNRRAVDSPKLVQLLAGKLHVGDHDRRTAYPASAYLIVAPLSIEYRRPRRS